MNILVFAHVSPDERDLCCFQFLAMTIFSGDNVYSFTRTHIFSSPW